MSHGAPDVPPTLNDSLGDAAEADLIDGVTGAEVGSDTIELAAEAPLADTLEQRTDAVSGGSSDSLDEAFEADPADVAEQSRPAVSGSDDDLR